MKNTEAMSEKYIRKNGKYFQVFKSGNFGKFLKLEDAIEAKNLLSEHNWNLEEFPDYTFERDNAFFTFTVIDDKVHLLGPFDEKPSQKTIEISKKRMLRNPNGTRYGLNITRIFTEYVINKQIAGERYIFGVFDNPEDAAFARNFLLDNSWNVNAFGQIEFDDETDTYKIVEVIDEKIYVLGTYESEMQAQNNIEDARNEFLSKIRKHKYGLSNHPHLDALTDRLEDLKLRFGIENIDDVWSFEKADGDVLNQVIFNLTPWQKLVYDRINGETTFEELKRRLAGYVAKNLDEKLAKNIEELINSGLVEDLGDGVYIRSE